MAKEKKQTVNIDGGEYVVDDLTDRLGGPPKFIIHPMISIKELKVSTTTLLFIVPPY